jgi:hypothetical protein
VRQPGHDTELELEPALSNSDEATIEHSQGIPSRNTGTKKDKQKDKRIDLFHSDIIGDEFWKTRPHILSA